jgi:ABC-type transport system involved in multi-copper enzyme maturation permease subunit
VRNLLLIAQFTWQEALGRRLLGAIILLTLVFLFFYFLGLNFLLDSFERRAAQLGRELSPEQMMLPSAVLVLMGMYIVNFLGSLTGVFTTIASISGEVDSGTLQSILPKPIRRWEFVLGRWLGHLSLALPYLLLMSLALVYGSYALTGYLPPNPLAAIALMLLSVLFLLTLTLLGSSLFSTLTTGVMIFMIYGLGWIGGILASVGAFTNTPMLKRLGEISSYLVPSDQLWRGASVFLQPEFMLGAQDSARGNPFVGSEPLATGYLLWVAAYTMLVLVAAVWVFRRRDF